MFGWLGRLGSASGIIGESGEWGGDPLTEPSAPVLDEPTEVGATSVTLSWSASTGNPTPEYSPEYSDDDGETWTPATTELTETTYVIETLTPETDYSFRVVASNTEGDTNSNVVTATTEAEEGDTGTQTSTWNADNAGNVVRTNGNLTATATSGNRYRVQSTSSKSSGLLYFEVSFAQWTFTSVGVGNSSFPLTNSSAGTTNDAVGVISGSGIRLNNVVIDATGQAFNATHPLGVAVDLDTKTIKTTVDGINYSAGVNFAGINAGPYFVTLVLFTFNDSGTLATGGTFAYPLPAGYSAWDA